MPATPRTGGRYISEGTYGCIFKPAVPCESSATTEVLAAAPPASGRRRARGPQPIPSAILNAPAAAKVSKVYNDSDELNEEWSASQRLALIDPEQHYFIYGHTRCPVSRQRLMAEPGATGCTFLPRRGTAQSPPSYPSLQMPDGGITLHNALIPTRNSRREPFTPLLFLKAMRPAFDGVALLAKHKFIHHDIKPDNILYNPAIDECRLIDFGIGLSAVGAFDPQNNGFLTDKYVYHPPEYHAATALRRLFAPGVGAGTAAPREALRAEFRKVLAGYTQLLKTPLESRTLQPPMTLLFDAKYIGFNFCDYERDFLSYCLIAAKKKTREAIAAYQDRWSNRIDVWSLGMTCLTSMYQLHVDTSQYAIFVELRALVSQMIHADPRKRIHPRRAAARVAALIKMGESSRSSTTVASRSPISESVASATPSPAAPAAPAAPASLRAHTISSDSLDSLFSTQSRRSQRV